MEKLDLLKQRKDLYAPPTDQPVLVTVPAMSFLMVDGRGDPNTSERYSTSVETLFSASYAIKFAVKRGLGQVDFKVMPLEGLWWAEDVESFTSGRKDEWEWTLMIAQPDVVTSDMVRSALEDVGRKKSHLAVDAVRLEVFEEGPSAQVMHIGPYSAEGPTIEKLHAFIAETGHEPTGKHHEIYLGDPRRTAPDRSKTVLRQPVQ